MIAHLHEREKKLKPFGLTGREAEWVALVCLHSGAFTRPQFCHFFEGAARNSGHALCARSCGAWPCRGVSLPNKHGGAKGCRIINKTIYRELGIENVRHRREADDSLLLRRLLSLDYVLEHPVLPWLPTEQEKVAFFELLGIDRNRIPHRIYHGAVGKQTRYFALKLPIAAMPNPPPSATSIRAIPPTPNCAPGARLTSGFGGLCGGKASRFRW